MVDRSSLVYRVLCHPHTPARHSSVNPSAESAFAFYIPTIWDSLAACALVGRDSLYRASTRLQARTTRVRRTTRCRYARIYDCTIDRPTWASAAPLAASIGRGVRRHATAMENTPRLGAAPAASPAGHVGLRAEHPNERCSWPQHAILRRAIDTHMCAAISLRAGSHHLPARTRFTHLRGDPVRASVRRILRRPIESPTWAAIPLRAGVRILRRRRDGRPTGDPVQSDRRLSASGCGSGMGHAIISWCLRKRASRPNDQVQQPRPLKRP